MLDCRDHLILGNYTLQTFYILYIYNLKCNMLIQMLQSCVLLDDKLNLYLLMFSYK